MDPNLVKSTIEWAIMVSSHRHLQGEEIPSHEDDCSSIIAQKRSCSGFAAIRMHETSLPPSPDPVPFHEHSHGPIVLTNKAMGQRCGLSRDIFSNAQLSVGRKLSFGHVGQKKATGLP